MLTIKVRKTSGGGELTTLSGAALRTDVVAAFGVVWDLPAMSAPVLARLESVTVTATLDAYGLTASASVPLVSLASLALDFTGYPTGPVLTTVGLVQCLGSTYHHAAARALGASATANRLRG